MPVDNNTADVVFNGRIFKRVRMGLDEKEILPFVRTVLEERDELAKRVEKSPTLTRFIEKIAVEADEWAEKTKREATEKASAEASAILLKAEEQAAQYAREKIAEAEEEAAAAAKAIITAAEEQAAKYLDAKRKEAVAITRKETEFIKHQAKAQVEGWVKEIKGNLIAQMRSLGEILTNEMRAQSEDLKRRTATFESDFEKQLADIKKQEIAINPGGPPANQTKPAEITGDSGTQATPEAIKEETATPKVYTMTLEEPPGQKKSVQIQIDSGEPDQIKALTFRLCQQSEVESTQLVKEFDKPALMVFLKKPAELIQKLMSFPEVKQVQEIVEDDHVIYKVVLGRAASRENVKDTLREQLRDWNIQL